MTLEVLFDLEESRALRDEGCRETLGSEPETWKSQAMEVVRSLPLDWTGLGEDIRKQVIFEVGEPHHHNCWGALILAAVRGGLLERTGGLRPATAVKSHARIMPILRRV